MAPRGAGPRSVRPRGIRGRAGHRWFPPALGVDGAERTGRAVHMRTGREPRQRVRTGWPRQAAARSKRRAGLLVHAVRGGWRGSRGS